MSGFAAHEDPAVPAELLALLQEVPGRILVSGGLTRACLWYTYNCER